MISSCHIKCVNLNFLGKRQAFRHVIFICCPANQGMLALYGAKKGGCISAAHCPGSLALTAGLINSDAEPHSYGCSAFGFSIDLGICMVPIYFFKMPVKDSHKCNNKERKDSAVAKLTLLH